MTEQPIDNLLQIQSNKHKIVGAIIQARMTSKRFPGKSMAILRSKPVIEHVIRNIKAIQRLDKVILAVPDTPESEPLLELAKQLSIENFCGDENNVLDRYYQAAKFFKLDIIMRITGDCPFIHPVICDEILQFALTRKLDYCSNCFPNRTYPKGFDCEVFTMEALEAAKQMADPLQPGDFEHVTPWMQRTEGLRRANMIQNVDASSMNFCVDLPEDIERLEKVVIKDTTDEDKAA